MLFRSRRAFLVGYTSSNNFPSVSPVQATFAGVYDGYFAKVDVNGNVLNVSSYLGGTGSDVVLGAAYLTSGDLFLVGATNSTDYPILTPYQGSLAGGNDATATRIGGVGP